MTAAIIEFLWGVYFIGMSVSVTRAIPSQSPASKSVDTFKLGFGIVLIVLALVQGVRII